MKFFVDTADTAEIADLTATGLVDGVTTNPSLVAKSGRDFLDVIRAICARPARASLASRTSEQTIAARWFSARRPRLRV